MSKYRWSVLRKGENPKVIRNYKFVTLLYKFILRNPAMFGGRALTIYNHGNEVANLTWTQLKTEVSKNLKEKEARKSLFERKECQ